jgi:tRNA/tmRNA/rRNA uracil-C5-methylase (TrmA/RlmC/RlmD family)
MDIKNVVAENDLLTAIPEVSESELNKSELLIEESTAIEVTLNEPSEDQVETQTDTEEKETKQVSKKARNDVFAFDSFKSRIEKSYKQISISRKMKKFFNRRYQLFNRFDSGILMDLEGWYSVTPEAVARHIAQQCFKKLGSRSDMTVLDAFCGSGGNTIQFANFFDQVVSCDINFVRLQCAQHNANTVYNVGDKVHFIMQDFFNLHKVLSDSVKFDMIFLSPPWGGISYFQAKEADISEFPLDCFKIHAYCKDVLKCENIVFFLPRNVNLEQVLYMAGPGGFVELEQNFLDHKLVAISSYHGDLCDTTSFADN